MMNIVTQSRQAGRPAPGSGRVRRRLMTGGAMGLCLAAMAAHAPLRAQAAVAGQAFQGTPTVVSGNAVINQTPTLDTITVTTPQTVINWRPNDRTGTGTIDFLPAGLRGLFVGSSDFTVLNRILPVDGNDMPISRMIALNGIIDSAIVDPVTGASSRGGNIWFYNAGGILVGSTGVINVGSLVLSARDIDTTGGLFGSNGEIRFRDPSTAGAATSRIEIAPGAFVGASRSDGNSAYIALVAPRIVQSGFVFADGSVGLVAAEQVDVRISNGLFDINVLVGTSDANGIVHNGSTGGITDASGAHVAYFVAVPKNQAMTMLLRGDIGFVAGQNASVNADGNIVISAGHSVNGTSFDEALNDNALGSAQLGDVIFRNRVDARASDGFAMRSSASCAPFCSTFSPMGQILFQGDATFSARNSINASVGQAQRIVAMGNLSLLAADASTGIGGIINLSTDSSAAISPSTSGGGIISVTGELLLDASARGSLGVNSGNAMGGTVRVDIVDGTLSAASIVARANAFTGAPMFASASGNGPTARGGTVEVRVGQGGLIAASDLFATANGTADSFPGLDGGDGIGGTSSVIVQNGGTIDLTGSLFATAVGRGAFGEMRSGQGLGGDVLVNIADGQSTINASSTVLDASGVGGTGNNQTFSSTSSGTMIGGTGSGGTARLLSAGTANLGNVDIFADGLGGDAQSTGSGVTRGGDGNGGEVEFSVTGGTATLTNLSMGASGLGGSSGGTMGTTGRATGGGVAIRSMFGGTLVNTGGTFVSARAEINQHQGGIVSAATGGEIELTAADGGTLNLQGDVQLDASADASRRRSDQTATSAAGATGGLVRLVAASGGTLMLGQLSAHADAYGADAGAVGGNATGGSIVLEASGLGTIQHNAPFGSFYSATGQAGAGQRGGTGTGGSALILAEGGTVNLGSFSQFLLTGLGGQSFDGTSLGLGIGGSANVLVRGSGDSALNFGDLYITADADTSIGGEGFVNIGDGATAIGGSVTILIEDGTVSGSFFSASANGQGTGRGHGQGGQIEFGLSGGTVDILQLGLNADGTSSNFLASDVGGNGTGGTVSLSFSGGTYRGSSIDLSARGFGGNGLSAFSQAPFNGGEGGQGNFDVFGGFGGPYVTGQYNAPSNGGDGFGGTINISFAGDADVSLFSGLFGDASGIGGEGGNAVADPFTDPATPGNGGRGFGGTINFDFESGTLTGGPSSTGGAFLSLSARGLGGEGGTLFVDPFGQNACGFFGCGEGFGNGEGGVVELPTDENHPDGGYGEGGTINIRLSMASDAIFTADTSGSGGRGGASLTGGNGGEGRGGTSILTILNADAGSPNVSLISEGYGGRGGFGINGNGGNGGRGNGGTARAIADGIDAVLMTGNVSFSVDGFGGRGGNASVSEFTAEFPERGGNGGNGGDGAGGTIELTAELGSIILGGNTSVVELRSRGHGGDAGNGANNIMGPSNVATFGGNAGFAGWGFGGDVNLFANGGSISIDQGADLYLDAGGFGGEGGFGGAGNVITLFDTMGMPVGTAGGSGFSTGRGIEFGGRIHLESSDVDDSEGNISLAYAQLTANGDLAGRIELIDNSRGAGINFGRLYAEAGGGAITSSDFTIIGSGIYVRSRDGAISVDGDADLVTSGRIQFDSHNDGGFVSTGRLYLSADELVARQTSDEGFTGDIRTFGGGSIEGFGRIIDFQTGTLVRADGTLQFVAGESLGFDQLTSVAGPVLLFSMGGITGNIGKSGGLFSTNSSGNTDIAMVEAATDVDMRADGSINVGDLSTLAGSALLQGNGVTIGTGNIATTLNISSDGVINLTDVVSGGTANLSGDGLITIGTLESTGGGIVIRQDSGLMADSLIAHDGIEASGDGDIDIDAAMAGGLIDLFSEQDIRIGGANGSDIRLEAFGQIDFGTINVGGFANIGAEGNITGTSIDAGTVTAESFGGDIDIGDIFAFGQVRLTALNGLVTGDSIETRFGNVFINANNVNYGTLLAGGLIEVDAGDSITIASATTRNNAGQGSAGNSGEQGAFVASTPAFDIILSAGGLVTLGTLDAQDSISITADAVAGANSTLTAGDNINVVTTGNAVFGGMFATSGLVDIDAGGNVTGSNIEARTDAAIVAAGSINIGALRTATGLATLTGNGVTIGTGAIATTLNINSTGLVGLTNVVSGGTATISAGGLATIGTLESTDGAIIINPANGVDAGSLVADGGINIVGDGDIDIDSAMAGGFINLFTDQDIRLGTATGNNLDMGAEGSIDFGTINVAGSANIGAEGNITGTSLTAGGLNAESFDGNIDIGTISSSSRIRLTALNGLVAGDLAETDFGAILINAQNVDYGTLLAVGLIDVHAANAITVASATTRNNAGQGSTGNGGEQGAFSTSTGAFDIVLTAGGVVTLGTLDALDSIHITGASLAGATSTLRGGDDITINTTGNAVFGTALADIGLINVQSGGSITGTSATTNGGNASFVGTTGVNLGTVRVPGTLLLRATGGNVLVSDLRSGLVTALGMAVDLTTTATNIIDNVEATAGAVTLRGTAGNLTVNTGRASGAFSATTNAGALSVGTVSGGTITLDASTTAALTGNVTATNLLSVTSRRSTTVNAVATGGTVRITSGDIVIGTSGRVGTGGTTTLVELINGDSAARTFIGGGDQANEYSLSASELARLFGGNITIRAPRVNAQGGSTLGSTRPPDVVIGAFTFTGGGATSGAQLGSAGTLSIITPGAVRVVGAAQLNNMNSGNGFSISADQAIEVILGQGSIRLAGTGPNGLGGTLSLISEDVVVATMQAITDIAAMTDVNAIDARLAMNDGVTSDDGALSAGAITFDVLDGVYVQNSGVSDDFDDRRGFTTNSLNIFTESSSSRIVINGRVGNDMGVLHTGIDAIALAFINDVAGGTLGGYDSLSTINGCVIANPASCSAPDFETSFPVQDVVEEEVDEEETGEGTPYRSLITLREAPENPQEPVLDDPITGSGNDDLWIPGDGE